MGFIILGAVVVAVATLANSQEESPVLWGFVALLFAILGGSLWLYFGQILGGVLAIGLMQLKIAKFG